MAFMTLEDLKTIGEELSSIAGAPNKTIAAELADRLLFKVRYFQYENPDDHRKLRDAIKWAQRASGRSGPSSPEYSYYRTDWIRFENSMRWHIQQREKADAEAAANAREVREVEP